MIHQAAQQLHVCVSGARGALQLEVKGWRKRLPHQLQTRDASRKGRSEWGASAAETRQEQDSDSPRQSLVHVAALLPQDPEDVCQSRLRGAQRRTPSAPQLLGLTWVLLHDVQGLDGGRRQHGGQRGGEAVPLTRQALQQSRAARLTPVCNAGVRARGRLPGGR